MTRERLPGDYDFQHRLEVMLGKDLCPTHFVCRCLWAAFALWTMSVPGTECFIPLHGWILFVGLYYFFPA